MEQRYRGLHGGVVPGFRFAQSGLRLLKEEKMKVPDEVRKTVAFVAYENKSTNELVPVGSVFFLGHDPQDGASTSSRMYAVTARHVIDGLRKRGCSDAVIRLNMKKGEAPPLGAVFVPLDSWFVHPKDEKIDVAGMAAICSGTVSSSVPGVLLLAAKAAVFGVFGTFAW